MAIGLAIGLAKKWVALKGHCCTSMPRMVHWNPGAPRAQLPGWACDLCSPTKPRAQKGPALGAMPCCRDSLHFWTRNPTVLFCTGLCKLCS